MSFKTDKLRRLAVDFQSFRDRIRAVISDGGQFKDYNYEFSNISLLEKNIAYVCELLSYMINSTASEASIDMTKTYKATNAIAEKFGYSPTGTLAPSATVDVSLMFSNMGSTPTDWYSGSYLAIPKYTKFPTSAVTPYMNLEKSKEIISYSTTKDWYFPLTTVYSSSIAGSGSVSGAYWQFNTPMEVYNGEFVTSVSDGNGQPYQVCTINNSYVTKEVAGVTIVNRHRIDHRFIDAYVYDMQLSGYMLWNRVESLSDRLPTEKIYEIRVNGNGDYDVRFGDGVNGMIPTSGVDSIQLKYLMTNMELGEIGSNMFVPYSSFFVPSSAYVRTRDFSSGVMAGIPADPSYWSSARAIISDVIAQNNIQSYISSGAVYDIKIEQPRASSRAIYAEPAYAMKSKILDFSRFTGKRLGNERAFEAFVSSQLSDYIQTSYAMNNTEYMNTILAEMITTSGYHTITEDVSGMADPMDEYVQTADPTFFNNLYLFVVPKNTNSIIHPNREVILKKLYRNKMLCSNVNVMNPIYAHMAFHIDIKKAETFQQDADIIRNNIRKYLLTLYDKTGVQFGENIDLGLIRRGIEGIMGVEKVNNIIVFEKDYYDFTSADVASIVADPLNFDDTGSPVSKCNFTYKLENYKFPVLNTALINNDDMIIVEQVGGNSLPSLDIV